MRQDAVCKSRSFLLPLTHTVSVLTLEHPFSVTCVLSIRHKTTVPAGFNVFLSARYITIR